MYLVKQLTRLLEFSAKRRIDRAQKRTDKAAKQLLNARSGMIRSTQELQMTQAEVLIQLNKLEQVGTDIVSKRVLNEKKVLAIDTLISSLNE